MRGRSGVRFRFCICRRVRLLPGGMSLGEGPCRTPPTVVESRRRALSTAFMDCFGRYLGSMDPGIRYRPAVAYQGPAPVGMVELHVWFSTQSLAPRPRSSILHGLQRWPFGLRGGAWDSGSPAAVQPGPVRTSGWQVLLGSAVSRAFGARFCCPYGSVPSGCRDPADPASESALAQVLGVVFSYRSSVRPWGS